MMKYLLQGIKYLLLAVKNSKVVNILQPKFFFIERGRTACREQFTMIMGQMPAIQSTIIFLNRNLGVEVHLAL